jgi:ribose transport system substrate-binding protein
MRDRTITATGTSLEPGAPTHWHRRSQGRAPWRWGVVMAAVAAATLVSACSSSTSVAKTSGTSSPRPTAGAGQSSGSGGSASSIVAAGRGPSNKFQAPGPTLNATSLKGQSLWYVTLSSEIPVLAVEQRGIQQSADALGMTLHLCDGKFQPAAAAGCINSAEAAGAKGILTDSIPVDSVSTAVANATNHHVPILSISEQGQNSKDVGFLGMGDPPAEGLAADWVIADSGGKANVLATKVLDDAGAIYDITAGSAPQFAKLCPNCSIVTATYTTGSVPSVASAVSSALLSHPTLNYGLPQFDFLVPLFKQGVQTAGFANKMKVVSTNSALSSMQLVKSGGQAADIGSNRNYGGWAATDAMLRLILGLPSPSSSNIPIRAFDKTNIDSVALTDQAALSGEWFGSLDYQKSFQQSWGLS